MPSGQSPKKLLLPNHELPSGTSEQLRAAWSEHLAEWLVQYPNDPRVLAQAAYRAMELEDFAEADRYARAAIDSGARFASVFPHGLEVEGEMTLLRAEALLEFGQSDEARVLLDSICGGAHGSEIREIAERYCQE